MGSGPVNSKLVKKLNRIAVLNMIKRNGTLSRQALSALTGLTGPAITGIVRELLQLGFIKETGLGRSQGGRKPIQLEINPESGYVLGAEVTRHETILGMANLSGEPILLERISFDMADPARGLDFLADMFDSARRRIEANGNLLAVGLAFPGLLDAGAGIVKRSVNLGPLWDYFPLKEALEARLGVKVFMENNSNAAVLAEMWYGNWLDCRDLIYINWGEGISAGIIADENILQGRQGFAGEMGHIVILEDGPLCNCGNRGCLEAICGIPALEQKVAGELPFIRADDPIRISAQQGAVTIQDIVECSEIEGSYCAELMRQVAKYMGGAVADLVNILNPQAIFFGGKMSAAASRIKGLIQETVQSHAFPEVAAETLIEISSLSGRAGFSGACALALRGSLESAESDLLKDKEPITS